MLSILSFVDRFLPPWATALLAAAVAIVGALLGADVAVFDPELIISRLEGVEVIPAALVGGLAYLLRKAWDYEDPNEPVEPRDTEHQHQVERFFAAQPEFDPRAEPAPQPVSAVDTGSAETPVEPPPADIDKFFAARINANLQDLTTTVSSLVGHLHDVLDRSDASAQDGPADDHEMFRSATRVTFGRLEQTIDNVADQNRTLNAFAGRLESRIRDIEDYNRGLQRQLDNITQRQNRQSAEIDELHAVGEEVVSIETHGQDVEEEEDDAPREFGNLGDKGVFVDLGDKGGAPQKRMPISVRQNNPLNILVDSENYWEGALPSNNRYELFKTMAHGVRAAMYLLLNYRRKHGLNTIESVINRWAPVGVDNSQASVTNYIRHVSMETGLSKTAPLDLHKHPNRLRLMVLAMASFEAGIPVGISLDIMSEAHAMLPKRLLT